MSGSLYALIRDKWPFGLTKQILLSGQHSVENIYEPLREKNRSSGFPSNQSFIAHARYLRDTTCLVLWLKFSIDLDCAVPPESLLFEHVNV